MEKHLNALKVQACIKDVSHLFRHICRLGRLSKVEKGINFSLIQGFGIFLIFREIWIDSK